MRRIALIALMTCFVPFLAAAPANAQATRTWVSGVGDDANPCSRTAPCKTFAGAISKTAPAGEINCLDSGGFGAVTITKAMTIQCEGVIGGILASSQNAIIVSAGANDAVTLRGLDLLGINALDGIKILSAKAVVVDKCVINGFGTNGIELAPTATVTTLMVSNTLIINSGGVTGAGVKVAATGTGFASALLRNLTLDRNFIGVSASSAGQTSRVDVAESMITSSGGNGLLAAGTGASIKVAGSFIMGNTSAATSGNVSSFGNNVIIDNSPDNVPPSAGTLH